MPISLDFIGDIFKAEAEVLTTEMLTQHERDQLRYQAGLKGDRFFANQKRTDWKILGLGGLVILVIGVLVVITK
jgi:hypothetical protein